MAAQFLLFQAAARRQDVVRALESLLAEAKRGELSGLLYIAESSDGTTSWGSNGNYAENPKGCWLPINKLRRLLKMRMDSNDLVPGF